MPLPIVQVDTFTDRPFRGNPAAVVLLEEPAAATWMQSVAAEMNLSETAFLMRQGGTYGLRWFTPAAEVDLCGHATLASAHVLWENGAAAADDALRFVTRSGVLAARREDRWIVLDFPAVRCGAVQEPEGLVAALGVSVRTCLRAGADLLVEVSSPQEVRAAEPDLAALGRLPVRGIIVTAAEATPDHDFVSRFFAPAVGVAEDPVTGSAHCALGPFWAERLRRSEVTGYQASRRGGHVRVRMQGDRVLLYGQGVTVLRGELDAAAERVP